MRAPASRSRCQRQPGRRCDFGPPRSCLWWPARQSPPCGPGMPICLLAKPRIPSGPYRQCHAFLCVIGMEPGLIAAMESGVAAAIYGSMLLSPCPGTGMLEVTITAGACRAQGRPWAHRLAAHPARLRCCPRYARPRPGRRRQTAVLRRPPRVIFVSPPTGHRQWRARWA
jgi:hypothetical protein